MKKLKMLVLGLENGEDIYVHPSLIDVARFGKVIQEYFLYDGKVDVAETFGSVLLEISRIENDFDEEKFYLDDWTDGKVSPLARLTKVKDIAQLIFKYEDGTKQMFYVPWGDIESFENGCQKVGVNDFYICVSISHANV